MTGLEPATRPSSGLLYPLSYTSLGTARDLRAKPHNQQDEPIFNIVRNKKHLCNLGTIVAHTILIYKPLDTS